MEVADKVIALRDKKAEKSKKQAYVLVRST